MLNYMIGKWKIMKHKKEGAGLYKKYIKNPPDSASLYQLSPKYLKIKSGNDLPYNQPTYTLHNYPGIRKGNPQSCMLNKYLQILENMVDFKAYWKCL